MPMIGAKPEDFTRDVLTPHVFRGLDAATYFVAGPDDEPPEDVLDIMHEATSLRVYPVDGGNLWVVPFRDVADHAACFERKTRGWDHDHCDCCGETIDIGETLWSTEHQDYGWCVLCTECRNKTRTI